MKKRYHFIYILVIIILIIIVYAIIKNTSTEESKKTNVNPWYFDSLNINGLEESNKTIAIIDSGYTKTDDLNDFDVIYEYNFINDNYDVTDDYGHGTALISILVGTKNNFVGILDSPKLIILKVMDSFGSCNYKNVNSAILKAIELKADIINLSIGSDFENEHIASSINLAMQNNILIVSSVGDLQKDNATFPARMNGVISVESQAMDGTKYVFSNNFSSTVRIPGFKIPVVMLNKITMQFEQTVEDGSSLSSIIFCGLLARSNYYHGSTLDYNYLTECKCANQFIDANKIFR